MDKKYKNPDNDRIAWTSSDPFAPGAATHQGMVYAIQHPFTGKMIYPSRRACWRYQQSDMLSIMQGWCNYELRDLHDEKERASVCGIDIKDIRPNVQGIVLSESLDVSREKARSVLQRGQWPKFYFTKNGLGGIRRKTYLDQVGEKPPTNLLPYTEVGHTDEAKKEAMAIFGGKLSFDTPKPTRLIERILQIATDKDSIVLDSFAGSGTTAHAVLNINKKDGGNRKFILIEMMDYAETITAERVCRVISGYGEGKNAVEGTGGGFDFYEIGAPLMEKGMLNESVSPAKIHRYVWYMETHEPPREGMGEEDFLGIFQQTAYYFHYRPKEATLLDEDYLATITAKAESYVIYADRCLLSEEFMVRHHIVFKKIPRDIAVL